jgi:hypothetical protein
MRLCFDVRCCEEREEQYSGTAIFAAFLRFHGVEVGKTLKLRELTWTCIPLDDLILIMRR